MDSALGKSLEAFKRRAISTPAVEKKKREAPSDSHGSSKDGKRAKLPSAAAAASAPKEINSYKSMGGSSQYKFGVLARIVKHMRKRHQNGDDHPLTLDDILDETNQLDVGSKVKMWLGTEALTNNPKIEMTSDGRYLFKAPFRLRDKKGLLRLLKQHDLKGMGGVLLEDVQESLPHCEKALKSLQNEIIYITRPMDKKKVLFYNDRSANFNVDEEFQKQWRAVAIESMDDAKIEEYLEKQGIRSMQDHGIKKPVNPIKRKKAGQRRKGHKPRDNEHLAHVLETYDDQK